MENEVREISFTRKGKRQTIEVEVTFTDVGGIKCAHTLKKKGQKSFFGKTAYIHATGKLIHTYGHQTVATDVIGLEDICHLSILDDDEKEKMKTLLSHWGDEHKTLLESYNEWEATK